MSRSIASDSVPLGASIKQSRATVAVFSSRRSNSMTSELSSSPKNEPEDCETVSLFERSPDDSFEYISELVVTFRIVPAITLKYLFSSDMKTGLVLSEEIKKDLKEIFNALDVNDSSEIELRDTALILRALGFHVPKEEARELVAEIERFSVDKSDTKTRSGKSFRIS